MSKLAPLHQALGQSYLLRLSVSCVAWSIAWNMPQTPHTPSSNMNHTNLCRMIACYPKWQCLRSCSSMRLSLSLLVRSTPCERSSLQASGEHRDFCRWGHCGV